MDNEPPRKLHAIRQEAQRRLEEATWRQLIGREWQRALAWLKGPEHGTWVLPAVVALLTALALTPGPWGLSSIPFVAGLGLVFTVFLRAVYTVWLVQLPGASGWAVKDLVFLASMLILAAVLARAYEVFSTALLLGIRGLNPKMLGFGVPFVVVPLMVASLLGVQAGMLMALCGGFVAALMWPDSLGLFAYFLLSGVVASHFVTSGGTRFTLIKAGLLSSVTGMLVLGGLALMRGWLVSWDFAAALVAAFLSGALGGVLAAGLAPLAEMAFGYTSYYRLMELSSLDHPALQELMLHAPGTYHHSLVVSSLVEAAAKEIGANALLAKAAALYHDIGKIKKSCYFVENQKAGDNRHAKLAPSMSALILISHVKEGVEVARQHRLGQPIIDILAQHHGNRLIHFFYNKAADKRAEGGQPAPDPEAFRYPGPRPQTREAGLVMLADSVEAACRSMENPTPARLQGRVQNVINNIFAEGQLDECELTLKDLHKIAKIFNKILSGIFHQRVEYPQPADKGRKNDSGDRQPSGDEAAGPDGATDQDPTDLKRLGIG